MELWADEEGRMLQNNFLNWVAERIVEKQQTRFEAFIMTIKQYKSG